MGHAGSAAPLPERGEQPLPRLVGHRLGGKFAEGTHGEAHLVEVAVAAVAFGEVGDEAALGLQVELVFQVRSDQLDELIAVEHGSTPPTVPARRRGPDAAVPAGW